MGGQGGASGSGGVIITFGGLGGTGGAAGPVQATNLGSIYTYGNNMPGINAQSVGGGGGAVPGQISF